MTFLIGFLGAAAAAVLLAAGAAAGWKACRLYMQHTRNTVRPPSQERQRQLEQEQQAFRLLQNYSAERAYGLLREEERKAGEEI